MTAVAFTDHREYTLAEYIVLEEHSNVRHEFLDGQILALAGGTPEHSMIAANMIALLSDALRGRPCRVHTSDARVRIDATGLVTYPDVSVVCGRAELDGVDSNALLNPLLLVEITSPSTNRYDRGKKLEHYRQIPALRAIILIAHEEPRVELLERGGGGVWTHTAHSGGSAFTIGALDCELRVNDIYRDPLASAEPS